MANFDDVSVQLGNLLQAREKKRCVTIINSHKHKRSHTDELRARNEH